MGAGGSRSCCSIVSLSISFASMRDSSLASMFGLLQNGFKQEAIRTMLGKFSCVTDQAIISNQLLIVARSIVGDGMRWAGVMAARKQDSFSVMWQAMRELFNIANMRIHFVFFLASIEKCAYGQFLLAVNLLHDIPLSEMCQVGVAVSKRS